MDPAPSAGSIHCQDQCGSRHRGTGCLLGEYARLAGSACAVARGFHPHLPLGEAAAGATNINHVFDSRYRPTACQLVRKASMRVGIAVVVVGVLAIVVT